MPDTGKCKPKRRHDAGLEAQREAVKTCLNGGPCSSSGVHRGRERPPQGAARAGEGARRLQAARQQLLGLAEAGWLPIVFSDYNSPLPDRVRLEDFRPKEWRAHEDEVPLLPLPPPGKLQQDYEGWA
jgi:hypothetical protein